MFGNNLMIRCIFVFMRNVFFVFGVFVLMLVFVGCMLTLVVFIFVLLTILLLMYIIVIGVIKLIVLKGVCFVDLIVSCVGLNFGLMVGNEL